MATDEIVQQLRQSSQTVARQIAKLTLEKGKIQEEINTFENSLTLLEAKIDVHKEVRDKFHDELKILKAEKNDYFTERDRLIAEKRDLNRLKFDTVGDSSTYDTKIDKISDKIGAVIEKSKAHAANMQELYEKGQIEHELMMEAVNELKQQRYESDRKMLDFKRKTAELDSELTKLRRKMSTINTKISEIENS